MQDYRQIFVNSVTLFTRSAYRFKIHGTQASWIFLSQVVRPNYREAIVLSLSPSLWTIWAQPRQSLSTQRKAYPSPSQPKRSAPVPLTCYGRGVRRGKRGLSCHVDTRQVILINSNPKLSYKQSAVISTADQ